MRTFQILGRLALTLLCFALPQAAAAAGKIDKAVQILEQQARAGRGEFVTFLMGAASAYRWDSTAPEGPGAERGAGGPGPRAPLLSAALAYGRRQELREDRARGIPALEERVRRPDRISPRRALARPAARAACALSLRPGRGSEARLTERRTFLQPLHESRGVHGEPCELQGGLNRKRDHLLDPGVVHESDFHASRVIQHLQRDHRRGVEGRFGGERQVSGPGAIDREV